MRHRCARGYLRSGLSWTLLQKDSNSRRLDSLSDWPLYQRQLQCNTQAEPSANTADAIRQHLYPANPDEPDTQRFTVYPSAAQTIVTSSAQNDSGMFDAPNLRDDRYLPFEGAGVIGRWHLELLGSPRQFDYDTIADLILTIRYTARAGAPAAKVSQEVEAWLKANSVRLFSISMNSRPNGRAFEQAILRRIKKLFSHSICATSTIPYRLQRRSLAQAKQVHVFARTPQTSVDLELFKGVSMIVQYHTRGWRGHRPVDRPI